jgi:hypothetical protein
MSIVPSSIGLHDDTPKRGRWKIVLIGIGVLVIGWVAVSPFVAAYRLISAIQEKDVEAVEAAIDFPAVRENLKADMNTQMASDLKPGDGFVQLGAMIGGALVSHMVDSYITPQGLIMLAHAASGPKQGPLDVLTGLDWQYYSWNRFSLITTAQGRRAKMVFFRSGVGAWRVHAIHLLDGPPAQAASKASLLANSPLGTVASEAGSSQRQAKVVPRSRIPGCVDYSPTQTLYGHINRETFAGPPNYTSIAAGDQPETYWVLNLFQPICVNADDRDLNAPARSDVTAMQLIIEGDGYQRYASYVNRDVEISGTLSPAFTGHHHTPLLLTVNSIIPK